MEEEGEQEEGEEEEGEEKEERLYWSFGLSLDGALDLLKRHSGVADLMACASGNVERASPGMIAIFSHRVRTPINGAHAGYLQPS